MLEISEQALMVIENLLANHAVENLGSEKDDVEIYWPKERLGLNAAKITIDAEFTVGNKKGDIKPDREIFEEFAHTLLAFLKVNAYLEPILNEGDPVAVWVKPDQGKSVWLSGSR